MDPVQKLDIIRSLKLPLQFNSEKLQRDLSRILEKKWIPHYIPASHSGDWKIIPLYAYDGDESNVYAMRPDADPSRLMKTPILKDCAHIQAALDIFQFPFSAARILRLSAGAEIKAHRDHNLAYSDGSFRLHIPITTNDQVQFLLDGTPLKMQPGECWYTNVNYIHSVTNAGTTDRVHLVIDGLRNEWSDNLFFSIADKERLLQTAPENHSPETLKRIIAELKQRNEPATQALIDDLENRSSQA